MTPSPIKWWVVLHQLKRVSPSIAPGWVYGEDRSRKTNLIEPQGNLEIGIG